MIKACITQTRGESVVGNWMTKFKHIHLDGNSLTMTYPDPKLGKKGEKPLVLTLLPMDTITITRVEGGGIEE